jgi:hypothetical protein
LAIFASPVLAMDSAVANAGGQALRGCSTDLQYLNISIEPKLSSVTGDKTVELQLLPSPLECPAPQCGYEIGSAEWYRHCPNRQNMVSYIFVPGPFARASGFSLTLLCFSKLNVWTDPFQPATGAGLRACRTLLFTFGGSGLEVAAGPARLFPALLGSLKFGEHSNIAHVP